MCCIESSISALFELKKQRHNFLFISFVVSIRSMYPLICYLDTLPVPREYFALLFQYLCYMPYSYIRQHIRIDGGVIHQIQLHLRKLRTFKLLCPALKDYDLTHLKTCKCTASSYNVFREKSNVFRKAKETTDITCNFETLRKFRKEHILSKIQKKIEKVNIIITKIFDEQKQSWTIEKLDLSGNERITEITFFICMRLCQLRSIDLSHCKEIKDYGFIALGKNSPGIEIAILNNCLITNIGLLGMLGYAKRIRKLDLSYCQEITSQGVKHIPILCPHLNQLKLSGCSKVTDKYRDNDMHTWHK